MGRYLKGGRKVPKKTKKTSMFKNPAHMVQFLSRSREDDPHWVAMVRSARDFLDERKVPKYKIKRNDLLKIVHHPPHEVAGMLMHDLRKAKQSKEKGAGIFSGIWNGISAITDEAAHLVGFDALKDAIGLGWDHIPLSNHEFIHAVPKPYRTVVSHIDVI